MRKSRKQLRPTACDCRVWKIATKAFLPRRLKRRRTISTGPAKQNWRLLAAFMSGSFRKLTAYEAIILTSRFLPQPSRWGKATNTWFSSILKAIACSREPADRRMVILDDDYEIDPATQEYKGYLWFLLREHPRLRITAQDRCKSRHLDNDVSLSGILSVAFALRLESCTCSNPVSRTICVTPLPSPEGPARLRTCTKL